MATLKVFKETALPGTLEANSIYFISDSGNANFVEIYVTGTTGTVSRHVSTRADIQTMIDNSMAAINELTIVANIAARDALAPTKTMYVYVENATGDATVSSGGATYLYKLSNTTWIKVSEAESLDVVLNWSAIQGKPTSSAANIDSAVSASHSHANKTQLDLVGQNGGGELTYNSVQVKTEWGNTGW
jgi:hypothetical protein